MSVKKNPITIQFISLSDCPVHNVDTLANEASVKKKSKHSAQTFEVVFVVPQLRLIFVTLVPGIPNDACVISTIKAQRTYISREKYIFSGSAFCIAVALFSVSMKPQSRFFFLLKILSHTVVLKRNSISTSIYLYVVFFLHFFLHLSFDYQMSPLRDAH